MTGTEVPESGKATAQQKASASKKVVDEDDEAYGNAARSSRDHLLRHSVNVARPLSALQSMSQAQMQHEKDNLRNKSPAIESR